MPQYSNQQRVDNAQGHLDKTAEFLQEVFNRQVRPTDVGYGGSPDPLNQHANQRSALMEAMLKRRGVQVGHTGGGGTGIPTYEDLRRLYSGQ